MGAAHVNTPTSLLSVLLTAAASNSCEPATRARVPAENHLVLDMILLETCVT